MSKEKKTPVKEERHYKPCVLETIKKEQAKKTGSAKEK